MTGPYTFKRFDVTDTLDHWDTPAGHWHGWRGKEIARGGEIDRLFVVICCPVCKKLGNLRHAVSAKGRVTPSVGCPHKPCPMHLIPVDLEGWDFGDRKKQPAG